MQKTPLPSWAHRDLETAIVHLIDARAELRKLGVDGVDAATELGIALGFLKHIRKLQEELVDHNGTEPEEEDAAAG